MRRARILVVDDNAAELERCVGALSCLPDVEVEGVLRSAEALARLGREAFDLLVTDLRMPVVDGLDLLRVAAAQDPDMPVLVLTGYPSVDSALSTLKAGAADYLTKPVHPTELQEIAARLLEGRRIRGEHRLLERRLGVEGEEGELVGASPAMVRVLEMVRKLAGSELDVLIVGETGTGKEVVARAIHRHSHGVKGRFVPVDCGAIPEQLLESELFGHEKGAFTGADRRSMGLLEYADGGTFFLDEVQSLPPQLQAKLLRALQERRFRRVGSTQEMKVRIRVVAALNQDPDEMVERGLLRSDLYHRLNVGRVDLPPLRERGGDIPLLVHHFLSRIGRGAHGARGCSEEAMRILEGYAWPGNVRQLQNALRRCWTLAEGEVIRSDDLPADVRGGVAAGGGAGAFGGSFARARERHLAAFERGYLEGALRDSAGDVTGAAKASAMSRATFYRLLKKHGVHPGSFRASQS